MKSVRHVCILPGSTSEVTDVSSGHGSMGRQPPGGLVSETAFVKVKTQLHFGWSEPSRRRCSEHISLGGGAHEERRILAGGEQLV